MSEQASGLGRIWRRSLASWLALTLLLALTFGIAFVPLGIANGPISLLIALMKAGIVVVLFMELKSASTLVRLAAAAGVTFLFVMFLLTSSDVLMRL